MTGTARFDIIEEIPHMQPGGIGPLRGAELIDRFLAHSAIDFPTLRPGPLVMPVSTWAFKSPS